VFAVVVPLRRTSSQRLVECGAGGVRLRIVPVTFRQARAYFAAEQAIGISLDEVHRAKDADVRYLRNVFPLLDLRMSRQDCLSFLAEHGSGETVKSACIGCPYSDNARLRWIRDTDWQAWQDVVAFDRKIRNGSPLAIAEGRTPRRQFFVHRSLKPLDKVDLDIPPRQSIALRHGSAEGDDLDGCSPWSCRSESVSDERQAA
jgi:hypothetical protein